jgi:hypothetical protein
VTLFNDFVVRGAAVLAATPVDNNSHSFPIRAEQKQACKCVLNLFAHLQKNLKNGYASTILGTKKEEGKKGFINVFEG